MSYAYSTYTGQKADGTGLLYYNARYYDPALGMFLSPDTVVPDAGTVIDYNRFLYARGNPLKYNDPSGHCVDGITTLLCVAIIGGVAGGVVDLGKQLLVDRRDIADVNWGEVAGATTGGFVAGGTMGMAPAGAGLFTLAALGGIGGGLGGQTHALTRAAYEHYFGKGSHTSIVRQAMDYGLLDPSQVMGDTTTGVATGIVGGGLARIFKSSGILSEPADMITLRGETPMIRWEKLIDSPGKWVFRGEGRTVRIDADTVEKILRSGLQGAYKSAEALLLAGVNSGTVEILDEKTK
jgi:RHS repeat-associated protein